MFVHTHLCLEPVEVKRLLNSLELSLWTIVRYHEGTEPGCSARGTSSLQPLNLEERFKYKISVGNLQREVGKRGLAVGFLGIVFSLGPCCFSSKVPTFCQRQMTSVSTPPGQFYLKVSESTC